VSFLLAASSLSSAGRGIQLENLRSALVHDSTIDVTGDAIHTAADRLHLEHVTALGAIPLVNSFAEVSVANSILSGTGGSACTGVIVSRGGSVFTPGCAGLAADGRNIQDNPLLDDSLQLANGVFVRPLRQGSPAINRGVLEFCRSAFHSVSCDAGAFESQDNAPTITGLSDASIKRESVLTPTVFTFTVGDDIAAPSTLTITGSSSNQALVPDANIVFSGTGAARTLAVTPLLGASGTAVITVRVSDGALMTTATFMLIVQPVYYLAEGATGDFFDLDLLIANPNNTPAPVEIVFLLNGGGTMTHPLTIAATSRMTIGVDDIAGLENAVVSSVVTSTSGVPLVVERTMRWDATGYGSHTETATDGAAFDWYFAEGAQGFFSTYILLANPDASPNVAMVTYYREGASAVVRSYDIPALSRVTIDASADAELVERSFGIRVSFARRGIAERAMYFSSGADSRAFWAGGHASAGATSPSTSWFLAEGSTGTYFNTFLLLANPNEQQTTGTITYLPASGLAVKRPVTIPALGRTTINIAFEDATLADTAIASRVETLLPIVVERSQYWPQPIWQEAHNSFGVTASAMRWGLAEGRVGGDAGYQTYILLANPGADAVNVTVTFLRENGTTIVESFPVAAESRFNVAVSGAGSDVPELADESFGTVIEATHPIVVERSLYNNANGVIWAAGTNAVATRLP
jgi:hypothetical protein